MTNATMKSIRIERTTIERINEAAYEALGILETLHEGGEIPLLYRDLVAAVIEKYHAARRDAPK
jgi:hypothetical protein